MADAVDRPGSLPPPSPASSPESPQPEDGSLRARGQMLGKYRIVGRLGKGGMGAVYQAEDTLLRRPVAVKLLPRALSGNDAALKRFLHEARAAGRLSHPNVVTVYEVNEHRGSYYLAMELVAGGSVQDLINARGALPWREAGRVIADACRGLAAAHAVGLIHRDIKPANLLRALDGSVKLADFGLAKAAGDSANPVTAVGVVLGTPFYMSPEQCRSEPLDPRSDIYSLGATFYTLLTARAPFTGDSPLSVMFAHCNTPFPDPRGVQPAIPDACLAILNRAVAKRPDGRYPSAPEMLAALEALLSPATVAAAPVSPSRPAAARGPARQKKKPEARGRSEPPAAPKAAPAGAEPTLVEPAPLPLAIPVRPPARRGRRWALRAILAACLGGASVVALSRGRKLDGTSGNGTPAPASPAHAEASPPLSPFAQTIPETGVELAAGGEATGAAFSPDGQWLAVSHWLGPMRGVRRWHFQTGEQAPALWRDLPARTVAYSPDGQLLAAGSLGKVMVLHTRSGTVTTLVQESAAQITTALAFTPDGKHLVAGSYLPLLDRGFLEVWDVERHKVVHSLNGPAAAFRHAAVSPDGKVLAAGGPDGLLRTWSLPDADRLREEAGAPIHALAFAQLPGRGIFPGRRQLTVAREDGVEAISPQGWRKLPGPRAREPIRSFAFAPRHVLWAGGTAQGDIVLRAGPGRPPHALEGHGAPVIDLDFSPDSRTLVSVAEDGKVRLWNVSRFLEEEEE